MPKVVGIRFKKSPKVYTFAAGDFEYTENGGVIVETSRGVEYGYVAKMPYDASEKEVVSPLKPVTRLATDADTKKVEGYEKRKDDDMKKCAEIIEKSGLEMKLVDIERTFDESKLIVHFAADGRVDFRELVKKLASCFHIRIELRQIGARDECRMVGGLGPCGRECCCSCVLKDYTKVSIKMAKNQNLSLNPGKISGLCGRLMCCLEYENAHYAETNKKMPKLGATVKTKEGEEGQVIGLNQLKETVKLKIIDKDTSIYKDIALSDLAFKGKGSAHEDVTDDVDDEELKSLIE